MTIDDLSRRIIPAGRITPPGCALLAEDLARAIERLEAWNIPVPTSSRAREAIARLGEVAAADSYGESPAELTLTANAISLAIDLRAISSSLDPARPGGAMGRDLARALRGSSERLAVLDEPGDLLTQYWFATLLARAGLRPQVVPTSQDLSPDFLISVGTFDCGVEVKRPTSTNSAGRALDKAATQLRAFGKPGVIAIDGSPAIVDGEWTVSHLSAAQPVKEDARPAAQRLFASLRQRVEDYSRSDKFSRVILLVLYARLSSWHESDMSQPDGWLYLQASTFPSACNGLVEDQAQHIKRALGSAVADLAVPGTVRRGPSSASPAV